MQPRVFELFAQVDASIHRSRGGLGIGLTLVRSLVEMHGGTVSASSGGPGMGSEFTVRIPPRRPNLTETKLEPCKEERLELADFGGCCDRGGSSLE